VGPKADCDAMVMSHSCKYLIASNTAQSAEGTGRLQHVVSQSCQSQHSLLRRRNWVTLRSLHCKHYAFHTIATRSLQSSVGAAVTEQQQWVSGVACWRDSLDLMYITITAK
jgi:hypothetical protein